MKSTIRILAPAIVGLTLTGTSHAQVSTSSLTLYGIVDSAIQYVKFDRPISPTLQAASGNLQASRLGFRGTEDLGGGYKANFQLEMGFNTYTGVAGGSTLWNRGSTVGLSSPYGSVDLGNMYLPIYWVFLGSDVATYGLSNPAAIMSLEHTVTLGKSGTGGFYPNAIRYRTPDLNGFSSEVGYSFGSENTGFQSEAGRNEGLNLQYKRGALWVGYGVNHYRYYANSTTNDASSQITQIVSGTYDFGSFVLGGNYLYTKRTDSTNFFASAEMVNAKVPFGPGDIDIGVARRIQNGGARAMAYNVGYVYFLSKRTQLYGYAAYIQNNGQSTQGFGLLGSAYAVVQPGFKPWAVTGGLRTSF
ncbi:MULTISPECIES: porin [Ralstonia]|jgi:predicted porin|uniref:Outer membrane porin protein 32 n=2 Tax=Pseudomonadota TaxID=1224 RepID=A0ABM9ISZ9_RALPI|nr:MULTISPECIES: porin [Ralstonia]MBA4233379.1 hypothetical protein [Ralstonia sp.]POH85984.1 hypothetical protein CJ026_003100 [Ralstonia pickettii]CAJ0729910.1 Outer membrane porin protein 32 [Ralstonia pickettii]